MENAKWKTVSLYVGNLPYHLSAEEVRALFLANECRLLQLHLPVETVGKNKGYALAEVPTGDVEKTIAALNGYELEGQALTVSRARGGA